MNNTLQSDTHSILLVEDDAMNQALTLAILRKMGLTADVANDGKHALTMLKQKKYDLVLMDCKMPVLNGLETTEIIRANESGLEEHVPIIAVTANAMKGDYERCRDAGMDDYIAKPFTKQILADAIYKWLPQAKQALPAQVP